MINETPKGRLGEYLKVDLAVARRHLQRINEGMFNGGVPMMVIAEISRSIEDCVQRIERDIQDAPETRETFLAKYGGVCPCCQNVRFTRSDKGTVSCPYCVTGELTWNKAGA